MQLRQRGRRARSLMSVLRHAVTNAILRGPLCTCRVPKARCVLRCRGQVHTPTKRFTARVCCDTNGCAIRLWQASQFVRNGEGIPVRGELRDVGCLVNPLMPTAFTRRCIQLAVPHAAVHVRLASVLRITAASLPHGGLETCCFARELAL